MSALKSWPIHHCLLHKVDALCFLFVALRNLATTLCFQPYFLLLSERKIWSIKVEGMSGPASQCACYCRHTEDILGIARIRNKSFFCDKPNFGSFNNERNFRTARYPLLGFYCLFIPSSRQYEGTVWDLGQRWSTSLYEQSSIPEPMWSPWITGCSWRACMQPTAKLCGHTQQILPEWGFCDLLRQI